MLLVQDFSRVLLKDTLPLLDAPRLWVRRGSLQGGIDGGQS
jgi:hypothetical protein